MKFATLIVLFCVCSVYSTALSKQPRGKSISTALSKQLRGKYRDCWGRWNAGERKSGDYVLYPNGTYPVKLHCNHTESGTSTLIQRRVDGSLTFNRALQDYQVGFSNSVGNYWAGLETIHHLTALGNNRLDIHMTDWDGNNRIAGYSYFVVMDRTQYYRLFINGFSGNVPNDMISSNGMYFYTPDRPDHYQCAVHMHAGWWYNYCTDTLPNGVYYPGAYHPTGQYYDGIFWKDWKGFGYSLRFFSMSVY